MIYIGGFMKVKKEYFELLFMALIALLLITFSSNAKIGALNGITLTGEIIIPSLLPVLIIFNLIIKTKAGRALDSLLSFFTENILKLPKCAGAAVVFGLIGGYPTGALLTEALFNNNDIDAKTARRLMRFNINAGAAFTVTAVGNIILHNQKAGYILFASTTASSIILALLSSVKCKRNTSNEESFFALPFEEALNASVENSIKSILKMSAYIILFSSVNKIIGLPEFLTPLIEITNGISNGNRLFNLPQISFLLSFSGLCIHFQLFSIIKKFKMSYFSFLFWRILHGAISYFICFALTFIFPEELTVFSNITQIVSKVSYVNPTLSCLMIIGCAVLIFDIESKKKRC